MENNDSTLSPFPGPNLQAHQSPGLCSNKSTSISLSSTPVGLSSAADTFLTTEPAEIATVDLLSKIENGKVDLSGKQLTALTDAGGKPRKGKRADGGEAPTIFQLNVAQNSLRSLDCANLPLQQCIEIDASHNVLSQMRCLSPLATHLVHLRLSDNRISSLGSLNSFCCLQTLDLSHNRIEHFPVLDQLTRLHHLNLASNHIKSVPNLSRLTSLVELDLHGNAICSLEFVRNFLPKDFFRSLDIGGNLLSDLCEFNHFNSCGLFLDALIVMGNPCTRMINVSQRTFSYRSFIYSCVLGDLKLLDGYFLNESEIIKGEWLHAQGHSRSFRPGTGTHDQLCAYLEKECSSKQDEMSLIEDDKLSMVIQKRREYNRSQSSTVITAKIGENVVKMDEQKAGKEKRITPAQRQQKMAIGNRNGEKKTAKVDSGGRTHSKKKTTTALAEKSDGRTKTTKAQQPTQLVRMSKSVTQLTSSRTTTNSEEEEEEEEAEEQFPPKERSHSAMDGFDTNRTVTTLVHESPVSPAHTIVLSGSSFDIVRLDLSKNESNQQHQQQFHAQPFALPPPPPLSPSPPSASTSALPVCPASSTSQFLPFSSTVSSPVSSRIPVNVTSLTARSLRYRQHNMLQKGGDATAIQQQQEEQQQKKPLRPIPSSSLSMVGGHRQKFVNQSERKMGATRRKSTTADQQQKEESTCSSKGSRKKGRFINLARKFNIRRKPSIGLHQSKRLSPASAPPQQTPRTLKGKVDELTMQNNLLTRINGEHVLTFQELATKIEQLEKEMSVRHAQDQHLRSLLIPTPANFKCKRHENEKGNDVLEIVWDNVIPLMSAVDSYELFLNGQQCKIKAKNRRLRITDLNPAEDIKVSICALSSALDGVRSATSEVIVSKHCADEEGKENSASMLDRPFPLIK